MPTTFSPLATVAVPAPLANNNDFLRDDLTWQPASGISMAAADLRYLRVDDDSVWEETVPEPVMVLTATGVSQVVVG